MNDGKHAVATVFAMPALLLAIGAGSTTALESPS